MSELFDRHRERLDRALEACRTREAWSPFVESPSRKLHPEGAHEAGKAAFEGLLGRSFELTGPWSRARVGEEVSPYTAMRLGVDYPAVTDVDALFGAVTAGQDAWVDAGVGARVGVCLEILARLEADVFRNAYATMHTAGQAFMMAFAGSGANSLDRGLEALAYAYKAMADVPSSAEFERRFGGSPVRLDKRYRLRPRGVALVVTCASYPAWNAYPAIFANLATGNPVVVKPHPGGTLPMATAVALGREVLAAAGFDPNLLVLAADTSAEPVTKTLALDERTAIVDFTGSAGFGAWLEENCRRKQVYTETAGCNAVIVESTNDLDGMLQALATGLALFSAQMCTAPQNIFVPRSGIETDQGRLDAGEFAARLVSAIDTLVGNPDRAAAVCGAVQSERTMKTLEHAAKGCTVLREPAGYAHPEFPDARTATPLVLEEAQPHAVSREEWFGPISFVLPVADRDEALRLAARDAAECGAIASYVYSRDAAYLDRVEDAFWRAGASIGCNLVGHAPMNFTAGFSDYHVTGLNPAGNACLTDLAFVANRFRIVQSKRER